MISSSKKQKRPEMSSNEFISGLIDNGDDQFPGLNGLDVAGVEGDCGALA